MIKKYQEEFMIRTCNCDMTGHWRPSAILETMQEMAGVHSELLGLGRHALLEKNIVWILTRVEVVMDRYPAIGDKITVETFPMPTRRWFFPRYFIFRNEAGEQIGCAGTLWALLDVTTRKMAAPDAAGDRIPDNSDLTAPMGMPATVREAAGEAEISRFLPLFTDLDVNQHVNNTRYMDWCCNALGIETMSRQCLRRFCVNYNMELRPGQEIRAELRRDGDAFSFSGFHGEQRHFDVGGTLADR